jgi:RNA polymerase sigma-70 factor (sigma-E family)
MDDELAEFCRREHRRLVATLDLLCGSLPLAEDLAQETLARVCRDWHRVREMAAPGAYAHRVAVNLATSTFRRRAAERRAQARQRAEQLRAPEPFEPALAVAVRQALQVLRPEQRQVLVLRYFVGCSLTETAEVLGMPLGTVKTHGHRGLAALRGALAEDPSTEDVMSDG